MLDTLIIWFPVSPTLNQLHENWVSKVLQGDLQKLHLQRSIITVRSITQTVLEQNITWYHRDQLFGHFCTRQSMSKKQLIMNGQSERIIHKYEMQIPDAVVSLALTDDSMRIQPRKRFYQ